MADMSIVEVIPAQFPEHRQAVEELFTAYAKSLGIDLAFQNFEEEFASLPGKYDTNNGGALFVARTTSPFTTATEDIISKGSIIGCVALRADTRPNACELKRLYTTPDARGVGAGGKLLRQAIETAKKLGYKDMLLDTLPTMMAARKMYQAIGFVEVEPYYDSPIKDTSFMKLDLTK